MSFRLEMQVRYRSKISSLVKHRQDEFNIDASDNSGAARDTSALRVQLDKMLSLSDFRFPLTGPASGTLDRASRRSRVLMHPLSI
jgi:hypothetical protein